jgi:sulfite reductase beta subunit-like hemoprotein
MLATCGTLRDSESVILMTCMTNEERMQRESNLIATIRKKLPDFARMCADDAEHVLLHQDAFAADYQEDEYMLLGMAIKYAGLRGKEVRVIGKNRSSFAEDNRIQ